jgi:pimeloyl-ACP methyl ester carboxylesterase
VAVISAHAAEPQPVLFTEGNFFVGPEPFPMYVEYFLPAKPTHETPIVLVHGCCTTGAGFVSTPDGREGWAKYFVRQGWKTYVVDLPGHGRSPMPESYSTMSLQRAVDDNVALLKKIGRSIFIVHSIGGMIGWKLCETVPNEVAAMIGVAPVPPANMPKGSFPAASAIGQSFVTSGPGPYLPEDRPAWFKLGVAKDAFASATLFPSEAMDEYYASLVPESPRAINELMNKDGMGLTADPQKFATVPKVIITGDQDPRHPRAVDAEDAKFLGADHIYLADVGLPGHGHPMYLDKGNEKIAQLILDWLHKKGI